MRKVDSKLKANASLPGWCPQTRRAAVRLMEPPRITHCAGVVQSRVSRVCARGRMPACRLAWRKLKAADEECEREASSVGTLKMQTKRNATNLTEEALQHASKHSGHQIGCAPACLSWSLRVVCVAGAILIIRNLRLEAR